MDPENDMEYQTNLVQNYNEIVETLLTMFGSDLRQDVISSIVESCDGDLNEAANVIMNMISDGNSLQSNNNNNDQVASTPATTLIEQTDGIQSTVSTMSYSSASKKSNANSKRDLSQSVTPQPRANMNPGHDFWTDQINNIVVHQNQGRKMLIILRGVPGSGKTHLAKRIVECTVGSKYSDYKKHILSTDDFFIVHGVYKYNKSRVSEAHNWNKKRASEAFRSGLSPILIDNTNIELWEMEQYVRDGITNGYQVELVEPTTPWAKKANILCKKNTHNVTHSKIKQMLENFQPATLPYLLKFFRIEYPVSVGPPVLNVDSIENATTSTSVTNVSSTLNANCKEFVLTPKVEVPTINEQPHSINIQSEDNINEVEVDLEILQEQEVIEQQLKYMKIRKQLDEMEKLEQEWENGDTWDEEFQSNIENTPGSLINVSKPPRSDFADSSEKSNVTVKNIAETLENREDWSKISMYMNPWVENIQPSTSQIISEVVKTQNAETCVDFSDYDTTNNSPFKILFAYPKDINFNHIPTKKEKIPEKRMFDKSTTTNDQTGIEAHRCKNEEKHFKAFRKLFKNIPKAILRDVLDKCCGDVNWAVDIVLDGMANNQGTFIKENEELSDLEDLCNQDCDCVAAYDIIPDVSSQNKIVADIHEEPAESNHKNKLQSQKKIKKDPNLSESSMELKRTIEKNVLISDNHYSDHCLKLRNMRYQINDEKQRGDLSEPLTKHSEVSDDQLQPAFIPVPGPSKQEPASVTNISTTKQNGIYGNGSDEEDSFFEEPERTIMIDLNESLLSQLDDLFGRKGIAYPAKALPRVSVPISILNEINALWMESLMCQLDEHDKQTELMLKQDEEFARTLVLKEQELADSGNEPEAPDLKEIMDMDYAISLYQKDVAKWRQKEPNDLAARLTREKLYNLFPDVSQDILSELLMAHDNNFQATVEVLLMSTGKSDILETKNGISKFVMEKELEIKEKILEEERKALAEVEWPLLPHPGEVDMQSVEEYRREADKHLARRNVCFQKAKDYVVRGLTQVASYYSDISNFHKQRYEQANSLAAASLIQVHAANSPDNATIDLHYMRVGEATESLDLFLDTHIQKLRETQSRGGPRYHTLFFITGRGLHSSNGRPRIKPAVKRRLGQRGLACVERNPGLLSTKVCAEDKLSYQVPSANTATTAT